MKIRILSKLLLIIILAISCNTSFACSCSNISPFLSTAKYSKILLEGFVIEHKEIESSHFDFGYNAILFKIEKVYNGEIKNDTILIAESTGFECFNSHFEDGNRYFVQGEFTPRYDIDAKGQLNLVNEILIPSICSESTIFIGSEEVCGKISTYPNKLNRWFYKITGKLKEVKSDHYSHDIECMNLNEFRRRLSNLKFKN